MQIAAVRRTTDVRSPATLYLAMSDNVRRKITCRSSSVNGRPQAMRRAPPRQRPHRRRMRRPRRDHDSIASQAGARGCHDRPSGEAQRRWKQPHAPRRRWVGCGVQRAVAARVCALVRVTVGCVARPLQWRRDSCSRLAGSRVAGECAATAAPTPLTTAVRRVVLAAVGVAVVAVTSAAAAAAEADPPVVLRLRRLGVVRLVAAAAAAVDDRGPRCVDTAPGKRVAAAATRSARCAARYCCCCCCGSGRRTAGVAGGGSTGRGSGAADDGRRSGGCTGVLKQDGCGEQRGRCQGHGYARGPLRGPPVATGRWRMPRGPAQARADADADADAVDASDAIARGDGACVRDCERMSE